MNNTGQHTMVTQTSFRISLLFIFLPSGSPTPSLKLLGFYPHPPESNTQFPNSFKQVKEKKKSPARSLRMGPNAYFEGVAKNSVVASPGFKKPD